MVLTHITYKCSIVCFGLSSDLGTCSSLVSPMNSLGTRLTCSKQPRMKSHRFFIFKPVSCGFVVSETKVGYKVGQGLVSRKVSGNTHAALLDRGYTISYILVRM